MKGILCFALCICIQFFSQAQNVNLEIFSSGGGNIIGNFMQQSWTLGEPITEYTVGSSLKANQGFQQSDLLRRLEGYVQYNNLALSPMKNTNALLTTGQNTINQTLTNNLGHFEFPNLPNGDYLLSGQCSKPWGGVNATDAMLVMKHYVNIDTLSGINLVAADVNANGTVNAVDALQIMQRFIGSLNSFLSGNWVFEKKPVSINGFSNNDISILALCVGDVDGSFIPSNIKSEPTINLEIKNLVNISTDRLYSIPVYANEKFTLAAASLVIGYPELVNTISINSDILKDNFLYNITGNEIRLAWYSLTPVEITPNEILFNIIVKSNINSTNFPTSTHFSLSPESIISDFKGKTIENKTLVIPDMVFENKGLILGQNIPNPVISGTTTINYSIPESGEVMLIIADALGRNIKEIFKENQDAGSHSFTIDCSALQTGIYFYKMYYKTKFDTKILYRKLINIHE